MKKSIALILILTSFLWLFGCSPKTELPAHQEEGDHGEESTSNTNPYLVRTTELPMGAPSIVGAAEFSLWTQIMYQDETAPKEIEVTFDNVTYHGVYDSTSYLKYNYYPVHLYYDGDTFIRVDPDGNVVHMGFVLKNEPLLEQPLTKEQCKEIATEYFPTMTEHHEEYICDRESVSGLGDYIFYFTKYVDGWKTADNAFIIVDPETGKIADVVTFMFGKLDIDTTVSFDRALIEEAVKARTEELYNERYERIEYVEIDYILTKISPTEYAVVCELLMCGYCEDESYMYHGMKYLVTETEA